MSKVPPVLLSAIICERVIFDKMTGMPSLINIVQAVNVPKYPARSGQFVFFCELTDGHGVTEMGVRLIDMSNEEKVIFEQKGNVEFKDVQQVVTLALSLNNVVFPQPGEYRFQLFCQDALVGERSMLCRQVEQESDTGEMQDPMG